MGQQLWEMTEIVIPDFSLRLALEEALVDNGRSQVHAKLEKLQSEE